MTTVEVRIFMEGLLSVTATGGKLVGILVEDRRHMPAAIWRGAEGTLAGAEKLLRREIWFEWNGSGLPPLHMNRSNLRKQVPSNCEEAADLYWLPTVSDIVGRRAGLDADLLEEQLPAVATARFMIEHGTLEVCQLVHVPHPEQSQAQVIPRFRFKTGSSSSTFRRALANSLVLRATFDAMDLENVVTLCSAALDADDETRRYPVPAWPDQSGKYHADVFLINRTLPQPLVGGLVGGHSGADHFERFFDLQKQSLPSFLPVVYLEPRSWGQPCPPCCGWEDVLRFGRQEPSNRPICPMVEYEEP